MAVSFADFYRLEHTQKRPQTIAACGLIGKKLKLAQYRQAGIKIIPAIKISSV